MCTPRVRSHIEVEEVREVRDNLFAIPTTAQSKSIAREYPELSACIGLVHVVLGDGRLKIDAAAERHPFICQKNARTALPTRLRI